MIFPFGTVGDTLVFCLRNCLCSNTFEIWILRILSYSSTLRNWPSRIGHAGGSDFRLYDGSDLKTYLLMRW